MQLKLLGIQGSTSIKTITAAIKGMSLEEAAAALTTTGLTDAEAANLLVKNGLCSSTEEAMKLLAKLSANNVAAAGSTDLLTAASLKLKAALKGVGTFLSTNLFAVAVAGIAAVTIGLAVAYKKWGATTENLAKRLDESKQKVQESTQKIEEMESELEQVQSRMTELQAMDSLTIVEQKELNNLKEANALLTRNLELEKQKRRTANEEKNKDFVNWFDSEMGYHSEVEQVAEIMTKASQTTGNPIVDGLNGIAQYFTDKNKVADTNAKTSEETYVENQFDEIDKLLEERKKATGERIQEIDDSLKEAFDYLNEKDNTFNDKMKDLELEYTPNAKKGSQEEKINERLAYVEDFKNKLLLKTAEYQGGIPEAYKAVLNNTLDSSRFSEAAKQIEELKTAEDGTARTSKQFREALYKAITKAPEGSNIKQLADYLQELGMIKIDPKIGINGITDFSNAIVTADDKVKNATKSNLLFADSFSKMSAARKAFEEGLQNVETGTEDYESYAESYQKAMELLNKGYDLDNGVLMAHVERLMSDEQLEKLGYDADKVKKFLQGHLKGVFGDKDTNEPGNGLIDKIKKYAGEDGKIYAKGKDGKLNKKHELASYKDGKWHISDDSKDIEELGKQFGMTTDEILACVKAMKTFSDVNLNDTDTIINKLKKEGKIYTATTEETDKNGKKKKKSAVNLTQLEADMESSGQYTKKDIFDTIQQLKNDKNIITVEIDAKTKNKKVAKELEELGILSGEKTKGKGHNQYKYRQVDDIDEATKALKKFGLTGQEAYEKLKKINIGDEDGKLLSDVEKIESVIKTFNSDFDIGKFKSINLKGEVPEGGKRTEIVNVIPLKEELEKKGYSSQFIDEYIKGLEQQKHVVTIDTSMEFTQKGDVTTVEDQLVAAGVATKGEDGKYTINVKETVTLLKNTGTDSDDVTTFLNNLKNAAEQDGSLTLNFSSNISSIEGEVQNVYSGVGALGDEAKEANKRLVELDNINLGNVTQQVNGLYRELSSSKSKADSLYQQLITISNGEYKARVSYITDPANDGRPTSTGAQASGTAYAGGNWGTAPGGKTLTGELG